MKPAPCLCGCGTLLARTKSYPLCRAATGRVFAFIRETAPDDLNERQRMSNRVWVDERTVAAILADDVTEAVRRVRYRADHGLYADPDRVLAAS